MVARRSGGDGARQVTVVETQVDALTARIDVIQRISVCMRAMSDQVVQHPQAHSSWVWRRFASCVCGATIHDGGDGRVNVAGGSASEPRWWRAEKTAARVYDWTRATLSTHGSVPRTGRKAGWSGE
jgi:hypothetical protein